MADDLFNLFGRNSRWINSKRDPLSIEKLMASDEINRGFDWGTLVSNQRRATQPRRQTRMPATRQTTKRTQQPRKNPQAFNVAFQSQGVSMKKGFSNRSEALRYYSRLKGSDEFENVRINEQ